MFSKKMIMIVGIPLLITINAIIIVTMARGSLATGFGRIVLTLVSPLQEVTTRSTRFIKQTWHHYFYLVNTSQENQQLKKELSRAHEENERLSEVALSNFRLRKLLDFQSSVPFQTTAAEIIGKDPSTWHKSIIINKGETHGLRRGLPVVVPEGIVGQVTYVSQRHARVMLMIDHNSAVDALVQRTRARGVVKGEGQQRCRFDYVLRKHDVSIGDVVISSGLDGVFPKGHRVGYVSDLFKRKAGVFQEVIVSPFVDFEKLEEVLIVLNPPSVDLSEEP